MRYLQPYINNDLHNGKIVLLGGPRQVGKTTLSNSILKQTSGKYFNYDSDDGRESMLVQQWKQSDQLLVFNEIHKYKNWKRWLKGLYDTRKNQHQFLVTGSARMDIYKQGGDSLLGRSHSWRLHPFTLDELPDDIRPTEAFERLMSIGGFPEPFLRNNEEYARRWRRERYEKIIREDIQDLEMIRHTRDLALLARLLQQRVGSTITISHLAQDLEVAPDTIKHWIEILQRVYLCFVIKPYTAKLARTLKKPQKIYFYDNADVQGDNGMRFENLVATHLLKRMEFLTDKTGHRYELRYIRDLEKHEVDFVILKDDHVEELIEAKWNDAKISKHLHYFQRRIQPAKTTQIVGTLEYGYDSDDIEVRSPLEYFAEKVW